MQTLAHHARFTRALSVGFAAGVVVVACESREGASQNAVAMVAASSGEGASALRDAAVTEANAAASGEPDHGALQSSADRDAAVTEAGAARVGADPATTERAALNGAACSPAGATRTFGDPSDRTHCTCYAHGTTAAWNCYTDSMAIEGPLPPPELSALAGRT